MTIISLNCWGGRRFEKLMPFIREKAKEVDVFCFQEMIDGGVVGPVTSLGVRGNLFDEMAAALPDFTGFRFVHRAPEAFNKDVAKAGLFWGEAMFIRNTWSVNDHGGQFLYSDGLLDADPTSFATGNMIYATVQRAEKKYTIVGVHGLFQEFRADEPGKRDTVERLEQSRRLVEFVKGRGTPGVVIGDLNLRPDIKSIAILAEPMRNLIAEHGVTNTRNFEYQLMEKFKDYIADYAFITRDLILRDFKVLPDHVSDHAALFLVIE